MSFAIRRYADADHPAVRDLFIRINAELAPPELREAFAGYVVVSLLRPNCAGCMSMPRTVNAASRA